MKLELASRKGTQAVHGVLVPATCCLGDFFGVEAGMVAWRGVRAQGSAGLEDGCVEEATTLRGDQVEVDRHRAGTLSKKGDSVRISAKGRNIFLHPEQRLALVPESVVSRSLLLSSAEEAKDANDEPTYWLARGEHDRASQ